MLPIRPIDDLAVAWPEWAPALRLSAPRFAEMPVLGTCVRRSSWGSSARRLAGSCFGKEGGEVRYDGAWASGLSKTGPIWTALPLPEPSLHLSSLRWVCARNRCTVPRSCVFDVRIGWGHRLCAKRSEFRSGWSVLNQRSTR